jgi:hypothetical protein
VFFIFSIIILGINLLVGKWNFFTFFYRAYFFCY